MFFPNQNHTSHMLTTCSFFAQVGSRCYQPLPTGGNALLANHSSFFQNTSFYVCPDPLGSTSAHGFLTEWWFPLPHGLLSSCMVSTGSHAVLPGTFPWLLFRKQKATLSYAVVLVVVQVQYLAFQTWCKPNVSLSFSFFSSSLFFSSSFSFFFLGEDFAFGSFCLSVFLPFLATMCLSGKNPSMTKHHIYSCKPIWSLVPSFFFLTLALPLPCGSCEKNCRSNKLEVKWVLQ